MCPLCSGLNAQNKPISNPSMDFSFLFLDGYGARELAGRWRPTGPWSYLLEWWTRSIPSHSSWAKTEVQGNECWWVISCCFVSSYKDLSKRLLPQYCRDKPCFKDRESQCSFKWYSLPFTRTNFCSLRYYLAEMHKRRW